MILYFSGTGNTAFAAEELARQLHDTALDLLDRIRRQDISPIFSDRPFIVCAPVYVSELPRFLAAWLKRVPLNGSRDIWFVITSAGYTGITGWQAKRIAARKNMRYMGCAELVMPMNYIATNFFQPAKAPDIEKMITGSREQISKCAEAIKAGKMLTGRRVSLPEILVTLPVNPLYCRFAQGTAAFRVTDACIGCGKCEKLCPLNVIRLDDNRRPVWSGKSCSHCMSCIQNCPAEAIEYGSITKEKERYRFGKYSHLPDKE